MIIALDLETTGLDRKNDSIIEVALVKFDEKTFEIIEQFSTLVNPLIPIPDVISNICNITNEDVKNAPVFAEIKNKISEFIWNNPILGHNTEFDRDFLMNAGIDLQKNIVLDTFFLANFLIIDQKSLSLESLCLYLKIKLEWAHRALNDTLATIKVFEKFLKIISKMTKEKKDILNFLFSKSKAKEIIWLKNYFFWENGEYINEVEFIKIILKKVKKYKKFDEIAIKDDLEVNFDKEYFEEFEKFELRENQQEMSELVSKSLVWQKKVVIEAPTWVGKTFAYLLPSILYSIKTGEKVFISTNTKALQDQIIYKDLEFFKQNLKYDFNFSKLKWKSNYVWIQPLLLYLSQDIFENYEVSFLLKIIYFLFETKTWEIDELNYFPQEYRILREINADKFITLKDDNPYKNYEFLYKARQNVAKSNVIIINHSLLLNDIWNDSPILWKIWNLIIDESHNLEDVTTDALKKSFNSKILEDVFEHIYKIIKKHKFVIWEFEMKKNSIILDISLLLENFESYIRYKGSYNGEISTYPILVWKDFFAKFWVSDDIIKNLELKILDFIDILGTAPDDCFKILTNYISFLEEILKIIKIVLTPTLSPESSLPVREKGATKKIESEKYISFVSFNEKYWVTMAYTLLNPGKYLEKNLWEKLDSCVLTSATLKIGNNFDYINNILHLDNFEFETFESDFDYSKQALLFIPNDLWDIRTNLDVLKDFLLQFFLIVKWKTLVLTTAFATIRELYIHTNKDLKNHNISLYAQGFWGSKHKLLEFFKQDSKNSILIWTDTFWEWIDIAWEDLSYLIIHKFPFIVPNDPIFMARSSLFKDAFRDYSIPKTIIKLKQGFGRLIRTKEDKWVAILLDNRIITTNWWEVFFQAFPENINVKVWNSDDFLKIMEKKVGK